MALKEFIEKCLDQQHAALVKAVEGTMRRPLGPRRDTPDGSQGALFALR